MIIRFIITSYLGTKGHNSQSSVIWTGWIVISQDFIVHFFKSVNRSIFNRQQNNFLTFFSKETNKFPCFLSFVVSVSVPDIQNQPLAMLVLLFFSSGGEEPPNSKLLNRVPKWWRHKNEICEIIGFVKLFWKNNVQDTYSPKISNSGQIVSEILAQLCCDDSIQILLNLAWFIRLGTR